jgi:hypothetical protein
MMKKQRGAVRRKRKLEIVIETHRRFALRKSGRMSTVLCEQCSGPMVSAEDAFAVTGLSSRAIHRLMEGGEIHFAETLAGALLICFNSLQEKNR